MKILFFVLAFCIIGIIIPSAFAEEKVPGWVKNNAEWWVNNQIDDKTFVDGIQFLINEEIIKMDEQIVDKNQISYQIGLETLLIGGQLIKSLKLPL